jgi:hypothetical protein
MVKGFGCRPVVTYPRALGPAFRKPPRKELAGAAWAIVAYGDLTGQQFGQGTRWPRNWRRIDNRGAIIVVAAVVDGAILA